MNKNRSFNLSLPLIFQIVINTLMGIIDLMMVSYKGGTLGVTALSISSNYIQSILAIAMSSGVSVGIIAFISRYEGERKKTHLRGLSILIIISGSLLSFLITALIIIFNESFLRLSGASEVIIYYGWIYIQGSALGIFFQCIFTLISALYIARGNGRLPLILTLLIFALRFIFGGVLILRGTEMIEVLRASSIVYSLSYGIVSFLGLYHYFYIHTKGEIRGFLFKESLYEIKEMLRLGGYSALEEGFYTVSRLLCGALILYRGNIYYAANEIANSVESLSVMPGIGLGIACTSLVGWEFGRGDKGGIRESVRYCVLWAMTIMGIFSIFFFTVPGLLLRFFSSEIKDEMIIMAKECLRIGALEQPFIAISSVYAGALKGLGDGRGPMVISIITGWFIRLPLIYYFVTIRASDVTAVWWITSFQWAVDAICLFVLFQYRYKKTKVVYYNLEKGKVVNY